MLRISKMLKVWVHCLLLLPLFVGVVCLGLVLLFSTLCSSFAISLMGKRKLVALLSFRCVLTVSVLWLFLTVS